MQRTSPNLARRFASLALCTLALLIPSLVGCTGRVEQRVIEVPKTAAIDEAKQILQMYVNGAPITSEASGFPDLITRAKAEDAAKGTILEEGLKKIQAQPNNRSTLARDLLTKL